MKFLLALSLLASSVAFAGEREHSYKCWDTAQERGEYPTYVFEVSRSYPDKSYLELELEYPRHVEFERKHGCWIGRGEVLPTSSEEKSYDKFKVCEGEGQNIHGLIPVEIDEENFEGTVYCERGLGRVFERRHDSDNTLQ